MLELALLGFLHEAPMHGYELRKRVNDTLGAFRALSCGTLYPTLRRMQRAGYIEEDHRDPSGNWGRRARRVYRLTPDGERRFAELVGDCGPHACEDDSFGVHVAFFSRTPADVRMRKLEARRRRVEERREGLRALLTGAQPQGDRYTVALHRLGFDHTEREVCWLNDLIEHERAGEHGSGDTHDRKDVEDT
ncbi:PadR family transcriptional regulator [Allosaccharopolyspora coralli]|uniref:PadR family transcriptional regulator n=1 Tax=Allosaccharopolyspora coralli TaxID=2665642 RepID=A0A5Q3QBM9_9PSEU|nr:PadR family transcriptional regulator [Allosaccharopolyspora coralli]QGK71872.1 PadR family transcriptional regulator [Allosaccharopolyspora coralli]